MFNAIVLEERDGTVTPALRSVTTDSLSPGDTMVDVTHSTLNYKDGLVLGGLGRIVRTYPHIPGIDFAGTVQQAVGRFAAGQAVVLTGWGVGERHSGGFAQQARVKADWLVPLPQGLSSAQAMAIGTAGLTAALAVLELERSGVVPGDSEVVVTGAAGGVGSIAVSLLARAGYKVAASTGRPDTHHYLRSLGASVLLDRTELATPGKPLLSPRWAGGIDAVGGTTLANVLAAAKPGATVAACGNAGGNDLPSSVLPFILRGVRLSGIDSVYQPYDRRVVAWDRLASDLPKDVLDRVCTTIALADVPAWGARILRGEVRGRVVIDVAGQHA